MPNSFSDLPWHDATLLDIRIDRRVPGINDTVVLRVQWPDNTANTITFSNCYACETKLNFGINAQESILNAAVADDSPELIDIREKWAQIEVDLSDLQCFEIQTNSTNSQIRIYALGFSLE